MTRPSKQPYRKSQAVKQLEMLAQLKACDKFPEIPTEWLAPRKYRDDTSNGLTKCIIDFLKFHNWQAERIANMGRQITNRQVYTDVLGLQRSIVGTHWIPGGGTNGTADISATIAGKSVKIEVKIGRDRQSQAQKQYQQLIEAAGGIYIIASSFAQFHDWYIKNFCHG